MILLPSITEPPAPFEWKKAVVYKSQPKTKYSDLCK
jgi:hypothetical protein